MNVTATGIPSTTLFTFNKEDHTLGNLLRSQLLNNPHVKFAGYKVSPLPPLPLLFFLACHASSKTRTRTYSQVPHPLVSKFELRVQTDGSIAPKQALLSSCHELVKDLGALSREFTKEFELRKMVGDSGQQL